MSLQASAKTLRITGTTVDRLKARAYFAWALQEAIQLENSERRAQYEALRRGGVYGDARDYEYAKRRGLEEQYAVTTP